MSWSARDRGLAEGLILMEDTTGTHGVPYEQALDPDMDGWFEIATKVDYAQAAIDKWRDGDGKTADPGTVPYVVNTRTSGPAPVPFARDDPRRQHEADPDDAE